jgi:transcription initiation factor IIE alpha subunit
MDSDTYFGLIQYLTELSMPTHFDNKQQAAMKRKARYFIVINGQLYKRNKQEPQRPLKVVRKHEVNDILYNLHEDPLAGHFALEETYRRVKIRYYWSQMYEDVRQYVQTCDACQRRGKNKRTEPLHPIKVGQPFDRIGMDIVGPLPKTKKGNKYIVVATEYLTKWPEARAIPDAKAKSVVSFFYEDIICRHGCPKELLTDRGTHFVNEMLNTLCDELGVKHKLSTAYHPQTNGLVERFNRTLCETLAKFANDNNDDWDTFIPSALFAYRTKQHETTRHEPFYLIYGRNVTLPIEFQVETQNVKSSSDDVQNDLLQRVQQITGRMKDDIKETQNRITIAQQKQKERHDKNLQSNYKFEVGQLVLKYETKIEGKRKLDDRWTGPYYIHADLGNGVYKLRTMDRKILKVPINGARLKPYHQRPLPEPMVIIER